MIFEMIYCPYKDSTRYIQSNIPLCLQDFSRASPLVTPSGDGVYLTVYPSSRPNTDTIRCTAYSVLCMVYSIQYTVYSVKYTVYRINYRMESVPWCTLLSRRYWQPGRVSVSPGRTSTVQGLVSTV